MPPRSRVALLTLVVVLAVVQPTLAGAAPTDSGADAGDVGDSLGGTVERHPSSAGATADGLRSVRADTAHERGHTGAGVAVGVVGQGFETGSALEPHVGGRRQVGEPPRSAAHDTAVAEVVAETAPDAELYLAGVGRTPTPAEYAAAVEWLTDRGVDIIVDSGSYFPSVAADERRITAAAERATDRGVVFVTSAGNYADRHWAGTGATSGWVAFAEDDAANALGDGDPIHGRVTVRLRWRAAVDYDLYLYRHLPNGPDPVAAKSADDGTGPGLTVEGLDVAVPRGRYYVGVYADDVAAATGDDVAAATGDDVAVPPGRIQVFAARHELEHTTTRGSMVAPATSDRVVAVGAAEGGDRAAYSSLSASGTVDIAAPADARTRADADLAGTSAAAPYVAGTAALVQSAGGDSSPARIESILERTADDESETVDALAAVEAASGDGEPTVGGVAAAASPSVRATDESGAWPDTTTAPGRAPGGSTDAAGTASTDAADRFADNVTRPADNVTRPADNVTRSADDGGGDTGKTDGDSGERGDRSDERNPNDGGDRSDERDRNRTDGADGVDRERRDEDEARDGKR